jgi:hypothetical protein
MRALFKQPVTGVQGWLDKSLHERQLTVYMIC